MKSIIYLIFFFIGLSFESFAQCACMGGAAIGGLTAIGGTANMGVLKEGYLRANLSSIYLFGDKFYGDRNLESGIVNYFETIYTNFSMGYGITNDIMIDTDLGYFPKKTQSYSERDLTKILQSDGFSHVGLTGKYNVFNSILNEFEFTSGAGLIIPIKSSDDLNLPQHVTATNGALGLNLQTFFHKGFKNYDVHLFLINRFDYHFKNKRKYKYGSSLATSFFITKNIIGNLSGYLELRNEFRDYDFYDKDNKIDIKNINSGGIYWVVSPQLNYSFYKFNISAFLNYPIGQSLNGSQLGLNYSIGLNLTMQTKIL